MRGEVEEKIRNSPDEPGVYIFKDQRGKIIYVGKARSLKNRLSSYLHPGSTKTEVINRRASDLEIIVTENESDALLLEEHLIKTYKPRLNVRLRDDKKYPYIKITVNEKYPAVYFTRDIRQDGSILFGPYTSARNLRRVIKVMKKVFKIRTCKYKLPENKPERPCIDYSMGICAAPCIHEDVEEYKKRVKRGIDFLSGKAEEVLEELEREMWKYAEEENFEKAALIRDEVKALRNILKKRTVVFEDSINIDVVGVERGERISVAVILKIREGKLISKEDYSFNSYGSESEDIVEAVLRNIYLHTLDLPEIIYMKPLPEDKDMFLNLFRERRGKSVSIREPRGEKIKGLYEMACRNAKLSLMETREKPLPKSLIELKKFLGLKEIPRRIEGIDISQLQGSFPTGSLVVFVDGKPSRRDYRKFKIKTVDKQNDFAMIKEVIRRRINDFREEGTPLPQLIIVDGGKGQLSSAREGLSEMEDDIPVFAFAKRTDFLYSIDGRVISIPVNTSAFRLLRYIRNESHRFAISYHRKLRQKSIKTGELDNIPGIGETKKKLLLRHFGSIEKIKSADREDLLKVKGIGKVLAEEIYRYFRSRPL